MIILKYVTLIHFYSYTPIKKRKEMKNNNFAYLIIFWVTV